MIKLFEEFNEYQLSYNQVKNWLDEMGIINYTINDNLTVDVNGNIDISDKILTEIPIQFNRVNGYFYCYGNKLTTLKGCPKYVSDSFSCHHNNLTSLEYSPEIVGRKFVCSYNKGITSLEFSPRKIGDDYEAAGCNINSFNCDGISIGDNFNIQSNSLSSLNNCPIPSRNIYISGNPLPNELMENRDKISNMIRFQKEYGIWNNDDTFNAPRFFIFLKDYETGILE